MPNETMELIEIIKGLKVSESNDLSLMNPDDRINDCSIGRVGYTKFRLIDIEFNKVIKFKGDAVF